VGVMWSLVRDADIQIFTSWGSCQQLARSQKSKRQTVKLQSGQSPLSAHYYHALKLKRGDQFPRRGTHERATGERQESNHHLLLLLYLSDPRTYVQLPFTIVPY
jgi:hypothetical protein